MPGIRYTASKEFAKSGSMMGRRWLLPWVLVCCCGPAGVLAQVTGVGVLGVTSTQAILSYTAPSNAACTLEVSQSPTYSPLVHDVNPALFPGANLDSRSGSISVGRGRIVVIGSRVADTAVSGARYSRALQADTDHYFRIHCGGSVETGFFHTNTIPLGDTRGELKQIDPRQPLRYASPSTSISVNPEIVDPQTGALYRQVPVEGWAYGSTTAIVGGCNIGSPGACPFEDASGLGWTPTGGTLGSALSAADGAYAEYSAAAQDPLWVRLGGNKYPNNTTFDTELSYQNLRLTASCTGPNCASGGALEICMVQDIAGSAPEWSDCAPGVVTVPLSTSETTLTICADAPCSNPEKPGDFIQFDKPSKASSQISRGRIYNNPSDASVLFFTDRVDCNRLFAGESISVYSSQAQTYYSASITSKSCAAPTPTASVQWASTALLNYNGTDGVPFFYQTGIQGNPRYGVLIRKKSAAAGATIRLNQLLWRAASHVSMRMSVGAGGFGKRCTPKATEEGFFHCQVGPGIIAFKPEPLEIRFLGMFYFFGHTLPHTQTGFLICGEAGNDFLWDEVDPNVFYCLVPSSYPALNGLGQGRPILLKMTYTGKDIPCGAEGSSCRAPNRDGGEIERWPPLPVSGQVLTPCLNDCSRPEDDYTVLAQMMRLDPSFDRSLFSRCEASAVQQDTLILNCRSGSQDSPSWAFTLDLGNRLAIGSGYAGSAGGTQQVFGSNPWFQKPRGRWCTLHTYQSPIGGDFAVFESAGNHCQFAVQSTTPLASCSRTAAGGTGTCDPCPAITFDGVSYAGRNWCGTVQVSSAWDGSWGPAPAGFAPGDPVNSNPRGECPMRYLQKVKPGDYFRGNGEWLRILQMPTPTTWIVERGIGHDQTINFPRQIATGTALASMCGAVSPVAQEVVTGSALGFQWHYLLDPFANGVDSTSFVTPYVNHAWHRGIYRGSSAYSVQIVDPTSPESMRSLRPTTEMPLPSLFAGKVAPCFGNGCERHPSASQNTRLGDSSFFADVNPLLFIPSGRTPVTHVSGHLYRFQGTFSVDPKHLPTVAFTGIWPLRNISAPGAQLSGEAADHGKFCIATVAGECHPSSSPGQVFFNLANLDRSMSFCRETQFEVLQGDICIGNLNGVAAATTQWRLPAENVQQSFPQMEVGRVVRRVFQRYREAATENVKIDPTGRFYLLRTNAVLKLPSLPEPDGIRRSTFIPMTFSVTPPAGTDNVVVEFGYDASFHCSENRAEVCIAAKASLDEADPYTYPSERSGGEAGISGVPCPSTCSVTVPALSNRMLYWRVKYRNSANGLIEAGPVQVTAVP